MRRGHKSSGYRDRTDAGDRLADELAGLAGSDVIVLALPRGGVPVAAPISRRLAAPLGLIMVRKLGAPGRPELAMGAVAQVGGCSELVRYERVLVAEGVSPAAFEQARARELRLLAEGTERYQAPSFDLANRTIVIVDDGLATGMTMAAAIAAARTARPARVVAAVPVASRQALAEIEVLADQVVCPLVPQDFYAVSEWFDDFGQTSDDEVLHLLAGG
jgi:predicted phosphoribosyltransferase